MGLRFGEALEEESFELDTVVKHARKKSVGSLMPLRGCVVRGNNEDRWDYMSYKRLSSKFPRPD